MGVDTITLDRAAMARAAELARRYGLTERQAVEIVRTYLAGR